MCIKEYLNLHYEKWFKDFRINVLLFLSKVQPNDEIVDKCVQIKRFKRKVFSKVFAAFQYI